MKRYNQLQLSLLFSSSFLFVLSCSGRDDKGISGPCLDLLGCCQTLTEEAASQCQSSYDQYHDHPKADFYCEQALDSIQQIGFCTDFGPEPQEENIAFDILDYNDAQRMAQVHFENDSDEEVPVFQEYFKLELDDGTMRIGDPSRNEGDCHDWLAQKASITCMVRFYDPEIREQNGVRITYRFGVRSASRNIPEELQGQELKEDSIQTCSDGVDNDRDRYIDCDDKDCCTARTDCGPDTYCGKHNPQCEQGEENTLSRCTDGCNNDGDDSFWIDCEDKDCCDVLRANNVTCPTTSYCGA